VQTYIRGNDFAIKNFSTKKCLMNILGEKCFRGKDLATLKILFKKVFYENLGCKPVFEEIVLQP
jgi:hypothetical protein